KVSFTSAGESHNKPTPLPSAEWAGQEDEQARQKDGGREKKSGKEKRKAESGNGAPLRRSELDGGQKDGGQ
ncbi:MAG TPA: hypothetical protein VNM37_20755, partial [Candidatus Dormibacteraeota bacterium]|nr:hypothetical protein [Candidatus Dormibacteraeota bacterium]